MKEAKKEKETEANERVKGKKREKESTVIRTVSSEYLVKNSRVADPV